MVREIIGASFREVYVEASLALARSVDPKGLYKRARAGHIPQLPASVHRTSAESPDVRFDTTAYCVDDGARQMRNYLADGGVLRSVPRRPSHGRCGQRAGARQYRIQVESPSQRRNPIPFHDCDQRFRFQPCCG